MAKVTSLWNEIVKFPAMLAFSSKRFVRCPSRKNIQALFSTGKAYSSYEAVSHEGPLRKYNTYLQKQVLKPDECQKQTVHKLQNLYERLKDYDPQQRTDSWSQAPHGFYLHGGVGTGKTILMDIFYDSIPILEKKRVHFYSFMLQLYSSLNRWNLCCPSDELTFNLTPVESIASELAGEAWLLCFDEMQLADFGSTRLLEGVFRKLLESGTVIVTTSNRSPFELGSSSFGRSEEALDSVTSLVGLLTHHCEVVAMNSGKDHRVLQKRGKETYFCPITAETDKALDEAFCRAVGTGLRLSSVSLPVYGRKVVVPIASENRVARFTFNELCRSPFGPADYITICNHFHTIFVEDIPQMTIYQKNEARRFLSFIDAVYESKVKLFCTAASSPDDLFLLIPNDATVSEDKMHIEMIGELAYDLQLTELDLSSLGILTGEEEIFSFKRCISRLNEMQSELYQTQKHRPQVFSPYLGSVDERLRSEKRRREREYKRRMKMLEGTEQENSEAPLELPLTPLSSGSSDWADEASYISWSNDVMRKEHRDLQRRRKGEYMKRHDAPKFGEEHFWGFGWWEKIMGRRKGKNRNGDNTDDKPAT